MSTTKKILIILFAVSVIFTEGFVSVSTPSHHRCKRRSSSIHQLSNSDADELDWRAFRAQLVQNGLPSMDSELSRRNSTNISISNHRYAHITTPLVEVGSILVSIPTTDLCQGLDQQYWHRSVVLITEVSDNLVDGNLEQSVPEHELALGEKRGKWSYRGLMLNRHTNSVLLGSDDETATIEENDCDTWKIQRGGDLLGLDSNTGTQFACLHRFGQKSDAASTTIVGNIAYTTLSIAQAICKENSKKYRPDDFMTFGGFVSWRPLQLEREMGGDRCEWLVLSVDSQSIWDELQLQRNIATKAIAGGDANANPAHEILLDAGNDMWKNFLEKVNITQEQATSRLPTGQLVFYDQMLTIWAEEQLDRNSPDKANNNVRDSRTDIGPGSIVRAKSPPPNDLLLYDAEFLRSTILVLEERADCTIGVILNHPMSAAIECLESEDPLPLRYGGPIDIEMWRDGSYLEEDDEDEIDAYDDCDEVYESFADYQNNEVDFGDLQSIDDAIGGDDGFEDVEGSFLWLHRSSALGVKKIGTQLGKSKFWLIKEDEALEYIQSGTLQLHDTMAFSSVSIWEKGSQLGSYGGGLREQVELNSMEVIQVDDQKLNAMWQLLTKQNVLTKETLDTNIDAAIQAWNMMSSDEVERVRNERDVSKERLATAALKAYLARNLLGDPLNILVELQED